MEAPSGGGQGRWGVAVALTAAILFLSALDRLALVAVPVALLLLLPPYPSPRWRWVLVGAAAWAVGMGLPVGPLGLLSRVWAVLLGAGFVVATRSRPGWSVTARALTALAFAAGATGVWLTATGQWGPLDASLRERLLATAGLMIAELRKSADDPRVVEQFEPMLRQAAEIRWRVFPAMLGIQSLASLALASWVAGRLRRTEEAPFVLGSLRQFRFNDQLIWVVIAGLALVALPDLPVATRVGYNALLFMGGLYALRGFGVLLFLVGGTSPAAALFYGSLAVVSLLVPPFQILFLVVLITAVLVGLGDTWLDVRGRAALAPPA